MVNRELNMCVNVSKLFVDLYYTHTHCLSALALTFDMKNECIYTKMQTALISLHSYSSKTSMSNRELSLNATALNFFLVTFGINS